MAGPSKFIELNRTFHELSRHATDSGDIDVSQAFHGRSGLSWDDVLKHPRTVILSEAGSGKTHEIRHIAEKLRASGKDAFFLRLEFIPNNFDVAFEVGTHDEFQSWLASDREGILLLDSIDEARLRSPQDFELAVRKIGALLQSAKGRVQIVLTGRSPAWRPKTDYDLCERHIGLPQAVNRSAEQEVEEDVQADGEAIIDDGLDTKEESGENLNAFKVISLDDLSREQVETFAKGKAVTDTAKFLDAIERADAWSFTARPQDLEDLVTFWQDKGAIGTRFDIISNSIERRLNERDQQRAEAKPLPLDKARTGAMLAAAAATFTQNQSIRVPDGAANLSGFPLQAVLKSWSDVEISVLLSRPVFDDEIYGAVRFHHRSVREFLAAEWLGKLLKREASRRAVESLLFKKQFGVDVVIPTTRPLLPWLAGFDEKIRAKVRKIAPEVIFEGGDPSALPIAMRREILSEVCDRLASGKFVHSATEYSAVQRFAHADLSSDLKQLFKTHASSSEVVGFLTRMIWLGQLKELIPEAKAIALLTTASQYTRIAAMRALRDLAPETELAEVRKAFLTEAPELGREPLGELLTELKPTKEAITWALQAIEKTKKKERYAIDRLADALTAFMNSIAIDDLPEMLRGLSALIAKPPHVERRHCEVSQHFSWLMKPAARAVERLIESRHAYSFDPLALELLHKFRIFKAYRSETQEVKTAFSDLIPAWVDLNYASFWHDVDQARKELPAGSKDRITRPWQARSYNAYWKFVAEDFATALKWITARELQDDKLISLSIAFSIYAASGRSKEWRQNMKDAVAGNAELEAQFQEHLHPPKRSDEYACMERKWKRRAAAQKKRAAELHEKNQAALLKQIDTIREAKLPNPSDVSRTQWFLAEKAREKSERASTWTSNNWRYLIPLYGKDVAEAFRDGVVSYWRRHSPELISDGAAPRTTSFKVIYGLTGLATEIGENPKAFDALSETDASAAARYAMLELNGFPNWFPAFFAKYPQIASSVILKEIEHELSVGKPDEDFNYVLNDVSWSGEWAWNALAPSLMAMIEAKEPKNAAQLHALLKIIQGSSIPDAELIALAKKKVGSDIAAENKPDWYAVWTGVEPDTAIPAFQDYLKTLKTDDERTQCAMRFVTKLWGGRRNETFGARESFITPRHLKSLYLLMHEHIRVQDDIDRANSGAYSPGLRDEAQDARNRILQELDKLRGKEAFIALDELANETAQNQRQSYLELLAKRKAEQEADLSPWTPENVRDFNERLDRVPTTHQELADLAELRILDLKDNLEEGDDSVATILKDVDAETKIRLFIGREMRQKAFGRYNIPQEEELADAKKPDLRFHGVGFDAPVPTELKIADKWTGTDLFERLENQLAGDYLRDVRSGRGLFVLIYQGDKKSWEHPVTKRPLDFGGLVEALQEHWRSLSPKYPGIEGIVVIGIDLTKRRT